ncbi:pullulanase-type alpha-1,6-glucosidase [Deinococcus maricopensis]|uniref:pullulanase n=1 Tax=Deinococcus maricopensis (strain DSM 21211 / LMG 22137 / NRRL B-23946 / LB-34) TaxID=709986 RepID=E8UBD1_DEIML|nr:pullulanase-type alpha-1,6-glucosidase [Deinococcus maricopensis]ADV68370.1 alpha-1,6-glucosidase, pullulanase-type [Deinococcus maricopensis DSM 21211]
MKRFATLLTFALTAQAVALTGPAFPAVPALPALIAQAAATLTPALPIAQNVLRVRYVRPDGQYTGWGLHVWEDTTAAVEWAKPLAPTGIDANGAYWDVPLKAGAAKVGFIVHNGDEKDPGADLFADPGQGREVLVRSGVADFTYVTSDAPVPDGVARLHYHRPDGQYDGWGLHAWEDTTATVEWSKPLPPTGTDAFGAYWDVPLKADWAKLSFIVHKGDEKDPGADMRLERTAGNQGWIVSGQDQVYTQKPDVTVRQIGDLTKQQAHWLTRDLIAVKPELVADGAIVNLHYSLTGDLKLTAAGVQGGQTLPLIPVPGGLSAALKAKYPHLAAYALVQVRPEEAAQVPGALRGQLAVSSTRLDDTLVDATGVQTYGALDDLDTYTGPLGAQWQGNKPTLRLWAPTAQAVKLHVWLDGQERVLPMVAGAQGVWSIAGDATWNGASYVYEVKVFAPSTGKVETNLVTDPYSLALTRGSARSVLVDLNDPALKPPGWDALRKPALASASDLSFYELHLRDFSVDDATVPAAQRGTYLAFTQAGSAGMRHLRALADAGLKAVHLLPTFDIATISEDKAAWKTPGDLSRLAPNSDAQQAAVNAVKEQDAYNWGYDPYHYMVPEGSYAVNPDARTREYRQMVMALNGAGLRVVQDVVFNHTNASGQAERSVLDRIVPGYYHRLDLNGAVTNSTCCSNTATEHNMMRRLMVDTLVLYARQYKIDAFRFDLMGHHMVEDLRAVRAALDALTVQKDGVDGRSVYVYGEGWDFGEVAQNARGANATQRNLYGLGIGTFNDRIRDAIRGGSPFGGLQDQGFATGLVSLPNGQPQNTDKARLLRLTDQIKVGLSGNLRDFTFTDSAGKKVTGAGVDYNGQPTGYAASPREAINYASAHDNQTLFDGVLLKAPVNATTAQRVRMQNLAHSLVLLGQGLPFSQAGDDLLRSKSFDTDSYNSGDWFNMIDWTGRDNGFGRGLPPAEKNAAQWDLYRPLLGNAALKPTQADAQRAADHYREMLRVRYSTPLFRLPTAQAVQQALTFLNADPGVIVMKLSGSQGPYRNVVVVFNGTGTATNVRDAALNGLKLDLHPALQKSSDALVRTSKASNGTLSVPALTTAVFVGK